MAEEAIPKKTGVERQAEILVSALERASQNGGILLNEKEKLAPHFYNKKRSEEHTSELQSRI